jgi:hypothetical protein
MKKTAVSFTFRAAEEDIKRLDQIQFLHGFRTRTKFLLHAGLQFDDRQSDAHTMAMLARIVYSVRQLENARNGALHLLKPADVTHIRRDVRRTMRHILGRAS